MADSGEHGARLITPEELSSTDGTMARRLKNRLEQRRVALERLIQGIADPAKWTEARRAIEDLENRSAGHLQHIDQYIAQNNYANAVKAAGEWAQSILAIEDKIQPLLFQAELPTGVQDGMDRAVSRLLDKVAERQDTFHEAVKRGIDELLDVKRQIVLTKAFGTHVTGLKDSSRKSAFLNWLGVFAALVTLGGAELYVARVLPAGHTWWSEVMVRVAIAGPLVFLVYFFYHQHRVSRLMELKYQHLEGFLGGGARELIEMVSTETTQPEVSRALYEKLAHSFVSLDDVVSALNRSQTPLEDAMKAAELVKQLRDP